MFNFIHICDVQCISKYVHHANGQFFGFCAIFLKQNPVAKTKLLYFLLIVKSGNNVLYNNSPFCATDFNIHIAGMLKKEKCMICIAYMYSARITLPVAFIIWIFEAYSNVETKNKITYSSIASALNAPFYVTYQ